jgi:hypothetical protein
VVDLDVSLNSEINFGVGVDPTAASDHLIVKGILGQTLLLGVEDLEQSAA